MKITILEGFQQITAEEELCENYSEANLLAALKKNGITLITGMQGIPDSVLRTTQTTGSVKRTGLMFTTSYNVALLSLLPDLSAAAVQTGFRLTLGEGKKGSSKYIMFANNTFTIPSYPDEAASYYFEIFATLSGNNTIKAELYCNRSLVGSVSVAQSLFSADSISIMIGSGGFFASGVTGTFMIGDFYQATVEYDSDHNATPSLLGSIRVQHCAVNAFAGGGAVNSLNKDIVAGLNSSDGDSGYLMLPVSDTAGVVTFDNVDNSDGRLVAVTASVTYQGASSPNNILAWRVKSGNHTGDIIEERDAESDINSWTTATQALMSIPGSAENFTTGNLNIKADLYNRVRG